MKTPARTLWGLTLSFGLGLLVSLVAMFVAAIFTMGLAMGDPWVLVPIWVAGPALSVGAWSVLSARSRRAGPGDPVDARRVGPGPSRLLLGFFGGILASLLVFAVVCAVEGLSPGERRSDVFGPYYTHPYRPFAGVVQCLFGLSAGGYLYYRRVMRPAAAGLAVGCVVLGLLLVAAF